MEAHRGAPSSYEEAIAYYLRDDVSKVLWDLSQRRLLHFCYYCEGDARDKNEFKHQKTFHCIPDIEIFRRSMIDAVLRVSSCRVPLFPFFKMEPGANVPGKAWNVSGWDFCLELDLDQKASFQGSIPALAVLEHFGVPVLGKFSGHRSLHILIPAEAFPRSMRVSPVRKQWMDSYDCIGRFLSRLVPAVNRTSWGVAKDKPITTPYSLHRYHGLISIPLTRQQAMHFDPATASLKRFPGTTWTPEQFDSDGTGMQKLLACGQRVEKDPAFALTVATEVFRGQDWAEFAVRACPAGPGNPIAAALHAGPVAINYPPTLAEESSGTRERMRAAILRIDDPGIKSLNYWRLFGNSDGLEWRTGRRETCEILAVWVECGLAEAFKQLLTQAQGAGCGEYRVARVVRLFALLPSPPQEKFVMLKQALSTPPKQPLSVRLFLTLATAELAAVHPEALQLLEGENDTADLRWRALITCDTLWQTEKDPVRTVAALCMVFGFDKVRTWSTESKQVSVQQVTTEVFGGNHKKFAFAVATVAKNIKPEPYAPQPHRKSHA